MLALKTELQIENMLPTQEFISGINQKELR